MRKYSGLYRPAALFLLTVLPPLCLAVDTRVWEQSDQAEFARGTSKNLSIRSDGHVTLAPRFQELDSTGVPYLWAVTQDSKGTLYYAGGAPTGATTKIFALPLHGKSKVFADISGLEIHALAVDSQDRLYAAVLPDAKIYRIDKTGKPELFFDPKCKYIWAMAFDRSGNLYAATGESGIVYRITPDGKGSEFFHTGETHARSMIVDSDGNLIIGTEPGGLILRVTPSGQGFVLYQTAKREVTAVAEHNGVIYAASVGSKAGATAVTGPAPILPAKAPPASPAGIPRAGTAPPLQQPAVGSLSASVTGGSELYRIQKDGFAQKIWNSSTDIVYAIAFDPTGKVLVGTGNKGLIYRIDTDQLFTQLLNTPPTQVTSFLQGKNGVIYATTGNVGNLYSIGPGLENTGSLDSEVFDADDFAYWGKAHLNLSLNGGTARLEARSGNLNRPQNEWSPWTEVPVSKLGGQVQSPPARFLQYRITLGKSPQGTSPELSTIDIAFLPKNIAPEIEQIEIPPSNYREAPNTNLLERSVMPSGAPLNLTLPPVGQYRAAASGIPLEAAPSATLQYKKGYLTLRWRAIDPNDDPLLFKVEIRGKNDSVWRLLKDKLQDRYYAFDTAAFADGEYVARITATDTPGNTPAQALSSSLESQIFTIDNSPPEIIDVKQTSTGNRCQIAFTARDALSWIDKAEYSINGGDWTILQPVNKVSDSQQLSYQIDAAPNQVIAVRIFDDNDNVVVKQFTAR